VTATVLLREPDTALDLGCDDATIPACSTRGDGAHAVQRTRPAKGPGALGGAGDGSLGAATGRRGDDWYVASLVVFGLLDGGRGRGVGTTTRAGLGVVAGNGSFTVSDDLRARVLELDGLDALRNSTTVAGVGTEHGRQGLEALLVLVVSANHDSGTLHVHLAVTALVEPSPVISN
jgi:hypothetical protein